MILKLYVPPKKFELATIFENSRQIKLLAKYFFYGTLKLRYTMCKA